MGYSGEKNYRVGSNDPCALRLTLAPFRRAHYWMASDYLNAQVDIVVIGHPKAAEQRDSESMHISCHSPRLCQAFSWQGIAILWTALTFSIGACAMMMRYEKTPTIRDKSRVDRIAAAYLEIIWKAYDNTLHFPSHRTANPTHPDLTKVDRGAESPNNNHITTK